MEINPNIQTTIEAWKCLRCGRAWPKRRAQKPVRCARCSSALWDKPRVGRWPKK